MPQITSFRRFSSSAFSRINTSGLTASNQNCWSWLTDLFVILAAGGTFIVTTRSIFARQIHQEPAVPCAFCLHDPCFVLQLVLKATSRNADTSLDNIKRGVRLLPVFQFLICLVFFITHFLVSCKEKVNHW